MGNCCKKAPEEPEEVDEPQPEPVQEPEPEEPEVVDEPQPEPPEPPEPSEPEPEEPEPPEVEVEPQPEPVLEVEPEIVYSIPPPIRMEPAPSGPYEVHTTDIKEHEIVVCGILLKETKKITKINIDNGPTIKEILVHIRSILLCLMR